MKLKDVPIGGLVRSEGVNYYDAPITFEVIGQNHYGNNTTSLLTERIISLKAFSAKEPTNPNSRRSLYGNNDWETSNIRQWLNSDKVSWYSSTHQYSEPPTTSNIDDGINPYNKEKGFLANFPVDFVRAIVPIETQYSKADLDGGGLGSTEDKVRLLSRAEVGYGGSDGEAFPKFTSGSRRVAKPTAEAVAKDKYDENPLFNVNLGWDYTLRTVRTSSSSHEVSTVNSSGNNSSTRSYDGREGIRPALDLPQDSPVELIEGIYYVKVKSTPNLKVNINGVAQQASALYVNINGEARPITKMYVNVNGMTREVK